MEVRGFEPLASSVRGKRSAGLSYTPGPGAMVDDAPTISSASAGGFRRWTTETTQVARIPTVRGWLFRIARCEVALAPSW